MACYDNIIGLSRADCPCIDTAPAEGYNTSLSGLYLSDLSPLDSIEGLDECGVGSIWEIMDTSRTEGTNTFVADTNSLMMTTFAPKREKFTGQIGEASAREILSTDKTYVGATISCNPMRGGRIKITKIGTLFSGAGTLTLKIHNSLNVQVWTGSVTIANGWLLNTLSSPIILPTYIDFSELHEYTVSYEFNPANPPRLNKISCGCGGLVPWFDRANPMYKNSYTGGKAWANWIMVGGWQGDTLTDFDIAPATTGTYMNGLAFQIELGCDIGQVLCNGSLDFATDPFAMSIAFAIRYKTAEILASKLLGSTELTRTNMINREYLKEMRNEWGKKYNDITAYIAEQASLQQNDCLTCKDESGMSIRTVFS